MKIAPSGPLDWLAKRIPLRDAHFVFGTSSESRALGLIEWCRRRHAHPKSTTLIRIENPASPQWDIARPRRDDTINLMWNYLEGSARTIADCELLGSPSEFLSAAIDSASRVDVTVLDISVLPKRVYAILVKQLLSVAPTLVVTYTSCEYYPEDAICFGALPPAPLPGFSGSTTSDAASTRLLVDLGFVALSAAQLIDAELGTQIDLVMPFPTSPAGFRRNWRLMGDLFPNGFPSGKKPRSVSVHRVHSLDAFRMCDLVSSIAQSVPVTAVPLGPKAHTLGLVLASEKSRAAIAQPVQLVYPQPTAYLENYSVGIHREDDGAPSIQAYCVKHNGKFTF